MKVFLGSGFGKWVVLGDGRLSNLKILQGSDTLPNGTIEINDVITDCSGNVVLVWGGTLIADFE